MAQATLVVSGLTKSYGDLRAVDDLCFDIARGETYGLLGPNGAGKTTTISMLCGLLRRDAGEVLVAGAPHVARRAEAKAAIGLRPPGPRALPGPHRPREPRVLRPAPAPARAASSTSGSTRCSRSSASPTAPTTGSRPTPAA